MEYSQIDRFTDCSRESLVYTFREFEGKGAQKYVVSLNMELSIKEL